MTPYIILVIIILVIIYNNKIHEGYSENNVCRGKLLDKEYLQHMIPHHQVAVDISIKLQQKTKSPVMHEILRKLIWMQNYEIKLMNLAVKSLPDNDMSLSKNMLREYIPTISDYMKPNSLGLTNTYCDPDFFNPISHMKSMHHMKLSDEMYIKHMIPHHQVAVDMSHRLLLHTNHSYLMEFCRKLIVEQQSEIYYMNNLLKNKFNYNYQSELLNN